MRCSTSTADSTCERSDSSPLPILGASHDVLLRVAGIGEETAEAVSTWERTINLAAEIRRIEQSGCRVLVQEDSEYPPSLREIYDPPIVLYARGTLSSEDHNAIAIVGSRQSTPYGIEVARRLGFQLGHIGVTVVSGGAPGIDTAAHQGALAARGRTVCVLGSGIKFLDPFPPFL